MGHITGEARESWRERVVAMLRGFAGGIPREDLFPTASPEATALAMREPFAFAMATCLDRGANAAVIWSIPFDLRQLLGHLDPSRIAAMSEAEIAAIIQRLPRKPRYTNDAPRTIHELSRMVVGEFGGDAAGIWRNKSAREARDTFLCIHGVGPGIANMAVLLIEKAFGVRFSDLDRRTMDIKPDVHTCRVLYRLGAASDQTTQAAIKAARWLNPDFPGEIDGALWTIGRRWCRPASPLCGECPAKAHCQKVGLSQ